MKQLTMYRKKISTSGAVCSIIIGMLDILSESLHGKIVHMAFWNGIS